MKFKFYGISVLDFFPIIIYIFLLSQYLEVNIIIYSVLQSLKSLFVNLCPYALSEKLKNLLILRLHCGICIHYSKKGQHSKHLHFLSLLAKLADKLKKSMEDEIHFIKGRVSELESDLLSKSTEVTSAVSRKEEALSSAFPEIDRLKEENFVKT
ncbi:uncharacterized protein LOC131244145 [Magnolia sinica]|uniref:uncharacterized protein LOC131244145 n=1 Tax=Magnolia sinica TaxID=86752 RepID=UPI002659AB56|nr:uncharacterized protein LOC131244145 [Magnolia sinica]